MRQEEEMDDTKSWMLATMCVIAVVIVAVGGVTTIVNPDTLTFEQYLDTLWKLAIAVAGFGGARAVKEGLQHKTPQQVDVDVKGDVR